MQSFEFLDWIWLLLSVVVHIKAAHEQHVVLGWVGPSQGRSVDKTSGATATSFFTCDTG
jgi:hypothetical protein